MTPPASTSLLRIAAQCVRAVADEFDRRLDWSLASLDELDAVCADLLADGSLDDDRLDLWWLLIGSYAGEVLVRHLEGHDRSRAPAAAAADAQGLPERRWAGWEYG